MEKEKCLTTTYKDDDITVEIQNNYYTTTFVRIYREQANKGTATLALTREQAARLAAILSIATEEAEI